MSQLQTDDDPLSDHVDKELLQSFVRLLGPDTFATIAAEVEKDILVYKHEIRALEDSSGVIPVRKLLHRLDGFAKQFGFRRLASFSSSGLTMTGADCKAVLPDCAEELGFLSKHNSLIFLGL